MQRGTTIIQHLAFRPNSSFSDPAARDGKIWNSALKQITQSQGWSQLHWGAHLASKDVVDVLISESPWNVSLQYRSPTHTTQPG